MIIPDFLQKGDKIGVVAPAGYIEYPQDIARGLSELRNWGLEIVEGKTPSLRHFQFAGTDEQRQNDLQDMLDQPEIKAIIAVRGGYGCSRIIDKLNFRTFLKKPKWIIGFSDLTLLLGHLENMGCASIHGPMLKQIGQEGGELATESLRKILFGETTDVSAEFHPLNRTGESTGSLIGGNLCLLAHSIGSRSEPDTRGKILFLEDVGEPLYNLDRMLWQLERAGKLKNLAALIAGQFTEERGNAAGFGKSAYEIIYDHIKPYNYPVCFNMPVGHVPDNRPLVVGTKANLEISLKETILTYHPSPTT